MLQELTPARSPSSTTWSLDPTMSVKRTVARTRSGTTPSQSPDFPCAGEEPSTSATRSSGHLSFGDVPTCERYGMEIYRDSVGEYRPRANGTCPSSTPCTTSVGTGSRKHVPHVDLAVHAIERLDRPGAGTAPEYSASCRAASGMVRTHRANDGPRPPPWLPKKAEDRTRARAGTPLRGCRSGSREPQHSCECAPTDERRRPLRMVAEEDAHRRSPPRSRSAQHARPPASITTRTSSIRVSSVGAPSTRSDMPLPACRTGSTARTTQAGAASSSRLDRPHQLDMRDKARDQDHIERPLAHDLVRDADIAASRVLVSAGTPQSRTAPAPACRHMRSRAPRLIPHASRGLPPRLGQCPRKDAPMRCQVMSGCRWSWR